MAATRGPGGAVGIWMFVILAIIVFFLLLWVFVAPAVQNLYGNAIAVPPPVAVKESDTAARESTPVAAGQSVVTVSEVFQNQDAFIGQTVTVRGQITEIVTSNIFVIGDEATSDQIIVSIADLEARRGSLVREDETIQVTGPVAEFDTGIFARENVNDTEIPRLGVMPMILANEVVPLTGTGAESQPVREPISREEVTPTTNENPAR